MMQLTRRTTLSGTAVFGAAAALNLAPTLPARAAAPPTPGHVSKQSNGYEFVPAYWQPL